MELGGPKPAPKQMRGCERHLLCGKVYTGVLREGTDAPQRFTGSVEVVRQYSGPCGAYTHPKCRSDTSVGCVVGPPSSKNPHSGVMRARINQSSERVRACEVCLFGAIASPKNSHSWSLKAPNLPRGK